MTHESDVPVGELKVAELRDELETRYGLETDGNKDELAHRLSVARGDVKEEGVAQVFQARFDPENPPEEDPGPITN